MFDFLGRFHRNGSRHCEECGRRTNYRRCDQCAQMVWQQAEANRAGENAGYGATGGVSVVSEVSDGVSDAQRAYLAGVRAEEMPDDAPFPEPPTPTTIDYSLDELLAADVFREALVVWLRLRRETLPPIREDWSAGCPWCAREMRELSDDTNTHRPCGAAVVTCARHHAAVLRLATWLRNETFRQGGAA
jgi:hypothetical protein